MRWTLVSTLLATACTTLPSADPGGTGPGETESGSNGDDGDAAGGGTTTALSDVRCTGTPDAGPRRSFRHTTSKIISALGHPQHRGFDLVAAASAAAQSIEGWISYTIADKALEDEDVDVFACFAAGWSKLGTARTDDEGHFALALADANRLPVAMRDLYVSVVGDRTGTAFLAYVAPDGTPLLVSDIDGTLTSSENAFTESLVTGTPPDPQPGAAAAFSDAVARGYQLVYVTARGSQYTAATRTWLAANNFPRGPLRLSPSFITLPGSDTIEYKTSTIEAIQTGFTVLAGIGNRASDVTAYGNVGLDGAATFVKLPEYQSEVQAALDAGTATGFDAYDDLRTGYIDGLPAR